MMLELISIAHFYITRALIFHEISVDWEVLGRVENAPKALVY